MADSRFSREYPRRQCLAAGSIIHLLAGERGPSGTLFLDHYDQFFNDSLPPPLSPFAGAG